MLIYVTIMSVPTRVNAIVDMSCNLINTPVYVEVSIQWRVAVSRLQAGPLATPERTSSASGSLNCQTLQPPSSLQLTTQHSVSKDVLHHVPLTTWSSLMETAVMPTPST